MEILVRKSCLFRLSTGDILKNIFNIFFYLGVFLKNRQPNFKIKFLRCRQVMKKSFVFINRTGCQGRFKDTFISAAIAVCVLIDPSSCVLCV